MGTSGLAVTGGVFFNDLSDTDGSLALANEGPSLDSCCGHSAPSSTSSGRLDVKSFLVGSYKRICLADTRGKLTALVNTTTMPTSTVLMLDLPLEQMILMYANSLDTMQMVYQFMDSAKIAVVRFRFFF